MKANRAILSQFVAMDEETNIFRPKLAPSILAADFWELGKAIEAVAPLADMIHVDVMDGVFVPNITMGNVVIEAIKRHSDLFVDCHLMAKNPSRHFESLHSSGADSISFHFEASPDPESDLSVLRQLGCRASIAISPPTPVEAVAGMLDRLDMVVVMSVNPGFAGQSFIPTALDKLRVLRDLAASRGLALEIQIDGGIKKDNVEAAAEAGATVFVAASAIFGSSDPRGSAEEIKRRAALGMARCPFALPAKPAPPTFSTEQGRAG